MEKLCKVRKHIQSLQAGCEPRGGRADTRRTFDFSPLASVLCINISNADNFHMLGLKGEDRELQKLPSNRSSAPKSPSQPEPGGCSQCWGLSGCPAPCPHGWGRFPKKTPLSGWRGAGRQLPFPGSRSSPYGAAEPQNCHRSLCKATFTSLSVAHQRRTRKKEKRARPSSC